MWNVFRQTGGLTDGGTDIRTDNRLSKKGSQTFDSNKLKDGSCINLLDINTQTQVGPYL